MCKQRHIALLFTLQCICLMCKASPCLLHKRTMNKLANAKDCDCEPLGKKGTLHKRFTRNRILKSLDIDNVFPHDCCIFF